MQLRHLKTVQPAQPTMARIQASAWSPNNKRLAVADAQRFVHLFDEGGERRDKFATKAADPKATRGYVIRGMAFAPDSTKLAIAQSDGIVFVYRLGLEWGDKKSICNKFPQASSVTCLCWPVGRPNDLVFGVAEGKLKVGNLKTNKSQTLYTTDSYVVSVAASADGLGLVSGHLDGSIYRFAFEDCGDGATPTHVRLATHSSVPYALAWGESIAACGNDCKVVFYDRAGTPVQHFDYPLAEEREFSCAQFNPSGHCLVVGGWNKFRIYTHDPRTSKWEEAAPKVIPNLYSVTTVAWKADGSRLVVTSLCGAVDLYDVCLRRHLHKGKFEFTYVSPSTVIVKRLSTGTRIVLKSQFGREIGKVNVCHDRYLIAHTDTTLLMGDLVTCKLSEVPWNGAAGGEQFIFENPQVCVVHRASELTLVEYGRNDVLGVCRTEHIAPSLVSVRVEEEPPTTLDVLDGALVEDDKRRKTLAYLLDRQTIRVLDLASNRAIATIHHTAKIDWLELNRRATKLLFRDKSRQLFLYNLATHDRSTLLNYCSYVQWVPDSDVVVAQNRGDLCVWYSIDTPDRVAIVPIKGTVEDIERTPGKTEVVVDEGVNTVAYGLDEALIEFGNAMDQRDLSRACQLLEQLTLTPETEAMWQALSQVALREQRLAIAERCAAALGDVAKAQALGAVNEMAAAAQEAQRVDFHNPNYDGYTHYTVQAALALLNGDYKRAETILLVNDRLDDAMAMWADLHKFDESIELAYARNHPEADTLKERYFEWLLEHGQEEKAGEIREREQRYLDAIELYLQAGVPARAARVVTTHSIQAQPITLEAIASSLVKAGMHEKAGDFLERLGMDESAVEAYSKGHAYRQAVDLSRRRFPGYVVALEERWGDWLVAQKQLDAAVNHYIEANQYVKAIESAIAARQWTKAVQIVDSQDPEDLLTQKFYKLIASHYEDARHHEEAEKYYVKAGLWLEAVEMYTRINMWDAAQRVAQGYMSEREMADLYIRQAHQSELVGKYKDAERLFLKANDPDSAIHMYKKVRHFDDMIRLVTIHRKELLQKTHHALAAQLAREGNLKVAEHHYVQAKEWKAACTMYREGGQWEEAIRVAKQNGGVSAMKHVVFAWALHLGGDAGAKLLTKFALVEQAIDYAIENGHFAHALELANGCMKSKLPYVSLKHAMFLEDEGHFAEAEGAFVRAGRSKEAIDMYVHQRDWANALRVADLHDPPSLPDVLVAQAREAFDKGLHDDAEKLLLRANKPEQLITAYKEAARWQDALRIAREHCPQRLAAVTAEYAQSMSQGTASADPVVAAKLWEESGEYIKAIDAYLKVTRINCPNKATEQLLQAWQRAVQLTFAHAKDRLPATLTTVEGYLVAMNRQEDAAQMYEELGIADRAVPLYVSAAKWDRAVAAAQAVSPTLAEEVRRKALEAAQKDIDGDDLAAKGDVQGALEAYLAQGDWHKLIDLVRQGPPEALQRYLPRYTRHLVEQGHFVEGVRSAIRDGIPDDPAYASTYRDLIVGFISALPVAFDYLPLTAQLARLLRRLRATQPPDPAAPQLERLQRIVHTHSMADRCMRSGLYELWAKLMVDMCKDVDIIAADKAFYDAGMAARRCATEDPRSPPGWGDIAFALLNRFLEINELVDQEGEADSSALDPTAFAQLGVPATYPIPTVHALAANKVDDVRQWVLTASLDPAAAAQRRVAQVTLSAELEEIFAQIQSGEIPAVLQRT
jgi:intraflagellar transport protein 172